MGYGNLYHMTRKEDWFDKGMTVGSFLWTAPPGAGGAVVECLSKNFHRRPNTFHLFVIPRLCTSHWRKQLMKACNALITILVIRFGLTACMNLLCLHFVFLFYPLRVGFTLGSLGTQRLWQNTRAKCIECRLPVNQWTGVFCGNFWFEHAPFPAC